MKTSDLPFEVKQKLMEYIRDQIGTERFDSLVSEIGEDNLIKLVLEQASNSNNPELIHSKQTINRFPSMIAGAIQGLGIGIVTLVVSFLLQELLAVPIWYSLAILINGVPIVLLLALLASTEREREYDFRHFLVCYLIAALIGAILGTARWQFFPEFSVFSFFSPLYDLFGACYGISILVGVIAFILALIGSFSLGNASDAYHLAQDSILLIFVYICIAIGMVAIFIDAPLRTPWFSSNTTSFVSMVTNHAFLFAVSISVIAGSLIGMMLPIKSR